MSKSDDIDVYRLIAEVHKRPIVWDRTFPTYKERLPTNNAWIEICSNLWDDFDDLKETPKSDLVKLANKKWVNIRDNWMKWYKRECFHKKNSKAKGEYRQPYVYHEILGFLQKFVDSRKGSGSMVADDDINNEDSYTTNVIPTKQARSKEVPVSDTIQYIDQRKTRFREHEVQERCKRHLCFFKGILPSVANLNENETLEFQIGVLNLIKSVRTSRDIEDVPVSYIQEFSSDDEGPLAKRMKKEVFVENVAVDALYQSDHDLSE